MINATGQSILSHINVNGRGSVYCAVVLIFSQERTRPKLATKWLAWRADLRRSQMIKRILHRLGICFPSVVVADSRMVLHCPLCPEGDQTEIIEVTGG